MSKSIHEKLMEHAYRVSFRNGFSQDELGDEVASACGVDTSKLKGVVVLPALVSSSWVTGGLCGGNCWGDEPNQSVTPQPEEEFILLDDLLEELVPGMKLSQYRKVREHIKHGSYTEYEYYGNHYVKAFKFILIDDIVSALAE